MYDAPTSVALHKYYLVGDWQLEEDERQVLRSTFGKVTMRFVGSEVNLVLGLAPGSDPVLAEVHVDGEIYDRFAIDHHDLYNLWKGDYGEHTVSILFDGKGVEGYAFTFGA